jgi:hypothetical protein
MKGFMHVVEILLIVLLVFLVFTQFANIPRISDDWSRTKLSLAGSDMLKALERRGVNWFDKRELEDEFNKTLPENLIYSVLLENVIKPEIKIGCLCDNGEIDTLKEILKPGWFAVNNENVTFEIIKVSDKDGLFSLDFDVVLIYGYEDLSPGQYQYALRNFLSYDKGVVEIFDPQIIDDVQKNIFGLDSGSVNAGTGEIEFSDSSKENGRETNKIYDYFHHIPVFHDTFGNLDQWSVGGNAEISSTQGDPEPSVKLTGNSESDYMYTRYYRSFGSGDIDFDVYLENGASLFVGFRRAGGYEYLASLSASASAGYDSFYRKSPLQSIFSNTSHQTDPNVWNHVKIEVKGGELKLYNNGEKVAEATVSLGSPSNITMFNLGGEAYVDNLRFTHEKGYEFENFLEPSENTTQLNNDGNKILIKQTGSNLPACIINYNVEGIGKGRTVWISNNSDYDSGYRTLVKSLISWAAGDEYRVIRADIKSPVSTHIYKPFNRDMFQNVKIVLELSYIY